MISWSPTGQLTKNFRNSSQGLPHKLFLSCLEVCVVCLQATSQLWPVWPTWDDGEGLVASSFCVLLWMCFVSPKNHSFLETDDKNHPVRWRLVEPIQLRLAVWSSVLRRFSRVGIFWPWQKPSANPGVEKFVANFSSGLRVNIFQNRRKSTRRACSTGAGRCAKFDTSCIRWIRPLLEVNGRRFLRAWD